MKAILFLWLSLMPACDGTTSQTGANSEMPNAPAPRLSTGSSPTGESLSNPFAFFGYSSSGEDATIDYGECIRSSLTAQLTTSGGLLTGILKITNACRVAVAVLTAPIELRLKLTSDQRFPFEAGGVDQVYALAYVFRKEFGFASRDTFLGDGGLRVTTLPDFAVVLPESSVEISLSSGEPLDLGPGEYGLALFTIAMPAPGLPSLAGNIDLRNSVHRLRASRARTPQLRLPPEAFRLGSLAYFEVAPTP